MLQHPDSDQLSHSRIAAIPKMHGAYQSCLSGPTAFSAQYSSLNQGNPGQFTLDVLYNYLYQVVMTEGGFEWDDAKAASNQLKHGVSFAYARTAFDDPMGVGTVDDRRNYGEERYNLIAKSPDNIMLFVTYTERETGTRIISARRASKQEVKIYDEQ